jgi:hypothetical protein
MKRVCSEVKASRPDFLAEMKHPLKRRIGMRYSNEFCFVTPAGLVDIAEIPAECGLVEAGAATADEWKGLIRRQAGFFSFDPDTRRYCMITIPAPWRDTPGPTWQLVAAMLRNQRREMESPPASNASRLHSFKDAPGTGSSANPHRRAKTAAVFVFQARAVDTSGIPINRATACRRSAARKGFFRVITES